MNENIHRLTLEPRFQNESLVKLLGGSQPYQFSHSLNHKLWILKSRARDLLNPRLYYRTARVSTESSGVVRVNDEIVFKSHNLYEALKNSDESVCFIGTIGRGVEREIGRLMRNNRLADAYIVDALGSVAVENMVERFQQRMEARYKKQEKSVTLRFSPGYCDWPITEQKKLFRVFDRCEITVELLDSCLMQPKKSISGIFGIAPSGDPPFNPCVHCRKLDCQARRIHRSPHPAR
jgi:hypothetical protein